MNNEPKFHFKDKVEVVKGFYAGFSGEVRNVIDVWPRRRRYLIDFKISGESLPLIEWIDEEDISNNVVKKGVS
jgi:transcription antitermination factor NusG